MSIEEIVVRVHPSDFDCAEVSIAECLFRQELTVT